MTLSKKSAMTLTEILIGFCVLLSISIVLFQVIHSFRKESTFNSENYVASSLVEKVLEQVYQESELNPHGMQMLGLTDSNGNPYPVSTHITDKESVFFQTQPITPASTPNLYAMLKDKFTLEVQSDQRKGFYDITTALKWKAETGKGETLSNSRVLAFNGNKQVLTTYAFDENAIKERIAKEFYQSNTNLEAQVAHIGGTTLIVTAAQIRYMCKDFQNTDAVKNKIKEADELAKKPTDKEASEKCSKYNFEIARDSLDLMYALSPYIATITSNISSIQSLSIENKLVASFLVLEASKELKCLRQLFFNSLLRLSDKYEQQIASTVSPKQQRQLIIRTLNIHRILYLNREFCEEQAKSEIEPRYKGFISTIQESFKDKDPAIYRMLSNENTEEIKTRYFIPGFISGIFAEINKLDSLI